MKSIMILLTAILGLGVTAWALNDNKAKEVKEVANNTTLTYELWDFTGTDPNNPEHYTRAAQQETCLGSAKICQVLAPVDADDPTGNIPDFSENASGMPPGNSVLSRIQAAVSGGANETATKKN